MKNGGFSEEFVLGLARRAYEEGDPGFEIVPENCALLVIDMQDEFVKPHWTPYWVPDTTKHIPRIQRLIESCRQMKIPVIYTLYSNTHGRLDRPRSGPFMPNRFLDLDFDQSSYFVDARIWHEIAPHDDDIVIHKCSYGAFYDTPLATILKNLGKDTIIVSGTMTNYCCGATARQGYERSFYVVFGSDVTFTDDPQMQANELKIMRRGFAKVMPSEEIIAVLQQKTHHGSS